MAHHPQLILRNATILDLATLQHWDNQPHVIASDPNDDWQWEEELRKQPAWRKQLMAELNGRPIGFIQIIDPLLEESHYWGQVGNNLRAIDICIGEKDDLGKGYGSNMMRMALEHCFRDPSVEQVLVDPLKANTSAHRFYERLGFGFIEERKFGEDDCLVYGISRRDWKNP